MEIEIRREVLNLHNGKENLSIVHLSDIHIKISSKKLDVLSRYLDIIQPNIVVMTGDYFDLPSGAQVIRKFIDYISVKYTVVYITGNHDHYYSKKTSNLITQIKSAFCIDNTNLYYRSPNGFTYNFVSKNSIEKTSSECTNILLIHNPKEIDRIDVKSIVVGFAGHLHGGQIILFDDRMGYHYPGKLFYKYCIDRIKVIDTTFFISKGLGDLLPIRWNCAKEIIHLTIF